MSPTDLGERRMMPDGLNPDVELRSYKYALDKSAIVAITDLAGRIVYVNEKFCEISGYSSDELIGKTHKIVNSGYHPKEFFAHLWKTITSGQIWVGEVCNRRKNGSIYWVYTTIVPFLDQAGKPYQYVAIRFPITDRKLAEERLKIYAQKLEVSNRELQDFASIAAHDLQEPLRKVRSFSDRLVTKFRESLGEEGENYLSRMSASVARMQTLIDDLLTFARVTTKTLPFQEVNLKQILGDVISDLEVRIENTKARVDVQDLPTIDADPSQMRQLFQNILGNALKFHKPDELPLVTVSANVNKGKCEIFVKDNGIGFDEKYLDRIFTIFQRLHGRHAYEGTGIGLAVCRRIVERHGGKITATSEPGRGATFVVTLPLTQPKEA